MKSESQSLSLRNKTSSTCMLEYKATTVCIPRDTKDSYQYMSTSLLHYKVRGHRHVSPELIGHTDNMPSNNSSVLEIKKWKKWRLGLISCYVTEIFRRERKLQCLQCLQCFQKWISTVAMLHAVTKPSSSNMIGRNKYEARDYY